jgi:hypothetical protein
MERAGRQALRVLGIVALSGLLLVSCGVFAILVAVGLFSERGYVHATAPEQVMVAAGFLAILAGAVFGIVRLSQGMRAEQTVAAGAGAMASAGDDAAPAVIADAPAMEQALVLLRSALGGVIAFSAAAWIFNLSRSSRPMRITIGLAISWALYQIPYAVILWRIRTAYDRAAVALAISFACASVAYTAFNIANYLRFYSHQQTALAISAVAVAIELAVIAAAWQARRFVENPDDALWLVLGAVGGLPYLMMVRYGTAIFWRW